MGESGWESNSVKPLDGSGSFYWKIREWVVFVQKWVAVDRFCWKMGRGVSLLSKYGWEWVFFLKNGWEWVVKIEIRVGVCRFCQKMGGSGLKNAREWVVFVKKWVGVGCVSWKTGCEWVTFLENWGSGLFLLKNGWEWVAFVEKWVGLGCFCWKMGGSGWEWFRVGESSWEWLRVAGSRWEWLGAQVGKANREISFL